MSTELVPLAERGPTPAPAPATNPHAFPSYPVKDVMTMAEQVARSRLFPGIETPQAAFTLMMLCQSEGLHPMQALKRYHIIKGRPSMRADAMQAEFQRQGGVIRWVRHDDEACVARFIHPLHAPDPGVEITWTLAKAKKADLAGKDIWKNYPAAMLRARTISEGVRMVLPGVVAGIYAPEEVADFATAGLPEVEPEPPPAPIDNGSGHGRGSYASPEQIRVYREKLDGFIRKTNAEWADKWTDPETGEFPDDLKAELVNTWQVDGHLLKWAVATGRLDQRIVPEQAKSRQVGAYVAIVYHRPGDRRPLVAELKWYVADEARKETEKWFAKHPESVPDPGEVHSSALSDDAAEPAPVGERRELPEDGEEVDGWEAGRE